MNIKFWILHIMNFNLPISSQNVFLGSVIDHPVLSCSSKSLEFLPRCSLIDHFMGIWHQWFGISPAFIEWSMQRLIGHWRLCWNLHRYWWSPSWSQLHHFAPLSDFISYLSTCRVFHMSDGSDRAYLRSLLVHSKLESGFDKLLRSWLVHRFQMSAGSDRAYLRSWLVHSKLEYGFDSHRSFPIWVVILLLSARRVWYWWLRLIYFCRVIIQRWAIHVC